MWEVSTFELRPQNSEAGSRLTTATNHLWLVEPKRLPRLFLPERFNFIAWDFDFCDNRFDNLVIDAYSEKSIWELRDTHKFIENFWLLKKIRLQLPKLFDLEMEIQSMYVVIHIVGILSNKRIQTKLESN